jgi:hypothetical protein
MRYLMIPGHCGSGAEHWQSRWQRALGGRADRIAPSSWDHSVQTDWCDAIGRAVRQAGGEQSIVFVAHSLGCLAAAVWLADHPRTSVAGAFLVAPPDRAGPRFPPVTGFDGPPVLLPVPAVVVASSDDPYCGQSVADALADAWGAALIQLGPAGHINTASGLGDWPEGQRLLRAFSAGPVLAYDRILRKRKASDQPGSR